MSSEKVDILMERMCMCDMDHVLSTYYRLYDHFRLEKKKIIFSNPDCLLLCSVQFVFRR